MAATIDTLVVSGSITAGSISAQPRTMIAQTPNAIFPIPWDSFRVWDAYATDLPGTAASDDLALVGGTFGTNAPLISAGDCKALGATTRRARFQVIVPECYQAAETLTIVMSCGMQTTVADTTCTVDIEAYKIDKITGISADLCATAATTMNSLVFSNKTFTITATTLSAGDVLDCRVSIACNDGATGAAVTPSIAGFDLVCDIQA